MYTVAVFPCKDCSLIILDVYPSCLLLCAAYSVNVDEYDVFPFKKKKKVFLFISENRKSFKSEIKKIIIMNKNGYSSARLFKKKIQIDQYCC